MTMMMPLIAEDQRLGRTEVAGLVGLAARVVPPLWPLESAIAVNPLAGFEDLPFETAMHHGAAQFGAATSLPLAQWRRLLAAGRIDHVALHDAAINALGGVYQACAVIASGVTCLDVLLARLVDLAADDPAPGPSMVAADVGFLAKWCAAFFDQGQAAAAMPFRQHGLYRAVLALAGHDPEFRRLTGKAGAQLLLTVPRDPIDAIAEALWALGVPDDRALDHLRGLVARMPGWAGHIRWRTDHADREIVADAPASMADLLAQWLLIERAGGLVSAPAKMPRCDTTSAIVAHFGLAADWCDTVDPALHARLARIAALDDSALGAIFMIAAERSWTNLYVPRLQAAAATPREAETPDAQLVFCIDVRSEPFRRALETQGRYDTFGYAGFFGLPVALHRPGQSRRQRLLPVLLSPQHDVTEAPIPGQEARAAALSDAQARDDEAMCLFAAAKSGSATAFATAEATGPLAGVIMATRTLAPRLGARMAAWIGPKRHTVFAPSSSCCDEATHQVFTLAEKIGYAMALFRLTGMTAQTARLVVLVGHGGAATNNPYAAALDCGACGGHAGGSNARMLAAMLNQPEVRAGLADQGLAVPATTVFLAAEHNTTTDTVTVFDTHTVPASHRDDLGRLIADLDRAGDANRQRRAQQLNRSADDLLTGAVHWGEVRPEWGLAGNAAFIVGPRDLTRAIDLDGRAFLHSYDWQSDADGSALATILTAPMVVAQWINCQYLFSTIDNHRYGSGDKTTQNVVGGIGVVQGNGGDLAIGLPRQSLFTDDGTPFHVPQRLTCVVHAPLDRVASVVEAHDILRRLFGKGWVHLIVIDPITGKARRWARDGQSAGEGATPLTMTLA